MLTRCGYPHHNHPIHPPNAAYTHLQRRNSCPLNRHPLRNPLAALPGPLSGRSSATPFATPIAGRWTNSCKRLCTARQKSFPDRLPKSNVVLSVFGVLWRKPFSPRPVHPAELKDRNREPRGHVVRLLFGHRQPPVCLQTPSKVRPMNTTTAAHSGLSPIRGLLALVWLFVRLPDRWYRLRAFIALGTLRCLFPRRWPGRVDAAVLPVRRLSDQGATVPLILGEPLSPGAHPLLELHPLQASPETGRPSRLLGACDVSFRLRRCSRRSSAAPLDGNTTKSHHFHTP